MPLILKEFDRREQMKNGVQQRAKLLDVKWVRWAAIATVIFVLAEFVTLILAVWNALTIHHFL